MNLILFETVAESARLDPGDARAVHIREVLRMRAGDQLFVGVVNGLRGKATIIEDGAAGLLLEVKWEIQADSPLPFWLLVGLPRPQTARDILREAATFGITALHFFGAEKGEPSYADSNLWKTDEWARRLREGAAQAFATTVPEVRHHQTLGDALDKISALVPSGCARVALDVYEASAPLSALAPSQGPVLLALGAERGWSATERNLLRETSFALAHLGPRVLRTETALVAGLSVLLAKRGAF